MTDEQIEELLGAYALDAVEADERRVIEAHLAECPRCRAEVAAHQEMAALLGSAGADAPAGLWEKIATSIGQDRPQRSPDHPVPLLPGNVTAFGSRRRPGRAPRGVAIWATLVAVAAAVMAFLGVEVGQLHSQVRSLRSALAEASLNGAAAAADAGPHRTISLALADKQPAAQVIVVASGGAYWLWSSLRDLPASQTYQLWGLTRGKPVSLALVGDHPDAIDFFKIEPDVTQLMVTAEPEGGTPGPTTAVLAQGVVPPSAVS